MCLDECGSSTIVGGTSPPFIPAKGESTSNVLGDVSRQVRYKWEPSCAGSMTHATRRGSKFTLSWPFLTRIIESRFLQLPTLLLLQRELLLSHIQQKNRVLAARKIISTGNFVKCLEFLGNKRQIRELTTFLKKKKNQNIITLYLTQRYCL